MGQAASGGLFAAVSSCSHAFCQGHAVGRCRVRRRELPLESWRFPYAASGWMTAIFSYWMGDINDAAVCRRVTL